MKIDSTWLDTAGMCIGADGIEITDYADGTSYFVERHEIPDFLRTLARGLGNADVTGILAAYAREAEADDPGVSDRDFR